MGRRQTGLILFCLFGLAACSGSSPDLHAHHNIINQVSSVDTDGDDSPLKLVGERLFRETRFSEYFFENNIRSFNQLPQKGDSVVESLETITTNLVHPYRGQSMACAACHFVDQAQGIDGGGQRAYTDFARRSPVPDIHDGQTHTVRNSPNMVASSLDASFFLHHDGEFATPEDLIRASMTGRNMGWKVNQAATAKHHIVDILRNDDGNFPTETDLGGISYTQLFAADASVPKRFQIPAQYRINISTATDEQVFEAMVNLVAGYMRTLDYKHDKQGLYTGSPFDVFLKKNALPRSPNAGETGKAYSARLAQAINAAGDHLQFVSNADGQFTLHQQDFNFGPNELAGYKVFAGNGNCLACHSGLQFTDHLFHNTGASQDDYDRVHGHGLFAQLKVPTLSERSKRLDLYLPNSAEHPLALGVFRSAPDSKDLNKADLGVWNIYANPSIPAPQKRLRQAICQSLKADCQQMSDEQVLAKSLAMIKTPTLRDLGHSQPYLHTGQKDSIEDVITFYLQVSALARQQKLRNADPEIAQIHITKDDVSVLTQFLKSLNEDYN